MAYTTIDDPSAYFQTALYTGTGSQQSITNDGNSDLQPDLLWIKKRSSAEDHIALDSTRGVTGGIFTNTSDAQIIGSTYLNSFDSDGFTVKTSGLTNTNTSTYVAWQWKANGGTTVTNTDGSENSTVQANTDAGFSIVKITGTGAKATYGHGLGVKPQVYLVKRTSATGFWVWATSAFDGTHDYFYLNSSGGIQALGYDQPTSSVFEYNETNAETSIVYCFAEKQGFSRISAYTGNGNSNGTFVYTGFKPAFVLIKRADSVGNWVILDNKRDTYNQATEALRPDSSNGTLDSTDHATDFLSNGFKLRGTGARVNGSSAKYIYMAFAENPFVTSTGIPTTAR